MKVVVVGGSGRIGSRLVTRLEALGHVAVVASPRRGVDTITGEGLAMALDGAAVVVDVTNPPSLQGEAAAAFFETSTRHLLAAEAVAGVGHHIALSVVGTPRLSGSPYFRGKIAQERTIREGAIPYTIVQATQFFEFIEDIARAATAGESVRVPSALIQPIAADDVVEALAGIAVGPPLDRTVELAGPDRFDLEDLLRQVVGGPDDPRVVVVDPDARYFGAELAERSLVPGDGALIASTRFGDWRR